MYKLCPMRNNEVLRKCRRKAVPDLHDFEEKGSTENGHPSRY